MKIICEKEKLIEGLNIVKNAVPTKTSFSVLECILIDARADQIKLISNNMELGIETVIEGEIVDKGMAAIKSKKFYDIIRTMNDTKISIDVEKSNEAFIANVSDNKYNFNIACDNPEEFTFLPYVEKEKFIEIPQFEFKEMIRQTIFSVYNKDTYKELKGELLEVRGNEIILVSSDRERISERKFISEGLNENFKIIIPSNTIKEILKLLSTESDKKVKISITQNHVVFEYDNTVVVSRLVEGEYFDVEAIKGKEYETKVKVNRIEFIRGLESALSIVRDEKLAPIILDIKDNDITIKITSALDEMEGSVEVNKEGQDILIAFNPNFILDVLRVIDDEDVNIYLSSPSTISFIKNDDETYNYQIMPSRFTQA